MPVNKNPTAAGHGHHSMPEGDTQALVITGVLTGVYFIIELIIGYWSGLIWLAGPRQSRPLMA